MAVYREILEDQLEILQQLQSNLNEKIKNPLPGKIHDDYMSRIVALSNDIRKVSGEIHEISKRESNKQ